MACGLDDSKSIHLLDRCAMLESRVAYLTSQLACINSSPSSIHALDLRSGREVGPFKEVPLDKEKSSLSDLASNTSELAKTSNPPKMPKSFVDQARETSLKGSYIDSSPNEIQTLGNSPKKDSKVKGRKKETFQHKETTLDNIPFPKSYFTCPSTNKQSSDEELVQLFSHLKINIPMLDLVKVPKYAKFLKDLCTKRRQCKHKGCTNGVRVCSLSRASKCSDPGSFTIPCTIGNLFCKDALLDLGAAINVMPKSIYLALGSPLLKETSLIIQLADRSTRAPDGLLEDVLVLVEGLVLPADFYVLDMSENSSRGPSLILGRPLLKSANTLINLKEGFITMEVGDIKVKFDLSKTIETPLENTIEENCLETLEDIELSLPNLKEDSLIFDEEQVDDNSPFLVCSIEPYLGTPSLFNTSNFCDVYTLHTPKLLPSIISPPTLELKTLPSHLKYAYLEEKEKLPIIISSDLTLDQEAKLLEIIREHKKAIGCI